MEDKAVFHNQDDSKATYANKILKSEMRINWCESAKNIIGKINGLNQNKFDVVILSLIAGYYQYQKMKSSLKFCVLAAGEADIYAAKARAWEWDIAAGHAVLEHAGGSITTHGEKKFLYGKDDYKNLPIIAKRSLNLEK